MAREILICVVSGLLLSAPALAFEAGSGSVPAQYPYNIEPEFQLGAAAPGAVLPSETLRLKGSLGAAYIRADELVFNGNSTLSHLIWESRAPMLRGSADLNLGGGFSVSAGGALAGLGASYMEDYDWFVPTNSFDNWTHQSKHPDTHLRHYFSFDLAGGYELARTETAHVRGLLGVKYTDAAWDALGGSYIYSVNGWRDTVGTFPDGEPGISYRQQLPEVFIGVDGEERYGNLTLGGMLRGGLTVMGRATDHHWMRDLRFEDSFRVAPSWSAGLDASYALGPMAEVFVAARYDQAMQMRGRTEYFDINTGAMTGANDDAAGAELRSIDLTIGLKGRF